MYDENLFFVPNPIDRYNLSQRNAFISNEDGSVDFYIQGESPGNDKEVNWLPAPMGKFNREKDGKRAQILTCISGIFVEKAVKYWPLFHRSSRIILVTAGCEEAA